MKGAGAAAIWLAGRPGALEDALKQAGVGAFIFAGCDVPAALEDAYRIIAGMIR